MRRLGFALAFVVVLAIPVLAVEGPEQDDDHRTFEISIRTDRDPVTDEPLIDVTTFPVTPSTQDARDGWDFGDRVGYRCAYVEHFTDSVQDFSVHYELVNPYPVEDVVPQINDRFGKENQATAVCGQEDGRATFDGTDHFPHSGSLVFYRDVNGDGFVLAQPADEIARIDYEGECGQTYWTPGDEPGEMWLWTDIDGPMDRDHHGDGLCNGGSGEPYVSARVSVMETTESLGYCTESHEGQNCTGIDEPLTVVNIGSGTSEVRCPDDSTPAVIQTDPLHLSCP